MINKSRIKIRQKKIKYVEQFAHKMSKMQVFQNLLSAAVERIPLTISVRPNKIADLRLL